jgi:hypothetical protein
MIVVVQDQDGNIVETYGEPSEHPAPAPMLPFEVCAVLNVVLGIWTLQDAANAIGRMPEDLISEAEAWAAAGGTP